MQFAGGALAAGAFGLAEPAAATALSWQRLEIVGNQFQVAGKPVRLRGVAVGDPLYVRYGRSIDDFRVIAEDWKANCVRISLHPGNWKHERDNCLLGLTRDISAARAHGLWVILDWHSIGFPGAAFEHPRPEWGMLMDSYESPPELAIDFWTGMAMRFGNDPGIIFELWNEPYIDNRTDVSHGKDWPRLKALYEQLIAAIRPHSDAILLASGARFAHDLHGIRNNLIEDPRTAYAWHCYPNEDRNKPDRWHVSLDGLPKVKPVVVTEWGFCTGCDAGMQGTPANFAIPFAEQVLDYYGLHDTAWCYSPGAAPQMLQQDGSPTVFGAFVKARLIAAGANGP